MVEPAPPRVVADPADSLTDANPHAWRDGPRTEMRVVVVPARVAPQVDRPPERSMDPADGSQAWAVTRPVADSPALDGDNGSGCLYCEVDRGIAGETFRWMDT